MPVVWSRVESVGYSRAYYASETSPPPRGGKYACCNGRLEHSNFRVTVVCLCLCLCWQVLGKDASEATAAAGFLLGLLDDYDALLSSDSSFQLGPWIAWARSWSYAGIFLTTRKRREKGGGYASALPSYPATKLVSTLYIDA